MKPVCADKVAAANEHLKQVGDNVKPHPVLRSARTAEACIIDLENQLRQQISQARDWRARGKLGPKTVTNVGEEAAPAAEPVGEQSSCQASKKRNFKSTCIKGPFCPLLGKTACRGGRACDRAYKFTNTETARGYAFTSEEWAEMVSMHAEFEAQLCP